MNRTQTTIFFIIVGVIIGLTLELQFKSGVPKESSYPLDQLEIQKTLLQSFADDQQKLEQDLQGLRQQYDEATQKLESGTSKKQKQALDKLKKLSSATDEKGEGIEVFLADSSLISRDTADPQDDSLIHASDLRDVINLLFSSEAKAISVNGRRILPSSSINVVGNTFVIQDFYTFAPFTIRAVGNSEVLLSRLKDENMLADLYHRLRIQRVRFTFQDRDELTVPAFSGVFHTQFLKLATKTP